ncbi:MAG TPA: RNA polymerase sigma factor, partial [Pirellulales bacterium]|nr:RNA polymerase sigma factor [Pirellulales bacterium]
HVAALFVKHADELRNFLIGVLRNRDQADDVLQVAFAKLVEVGHTAREESVKGWLFRVAYNEAIVVRRRQAIHRRATDTLAETENRSPLPPDVPLLRRETVEQVRAAIEQLPAEQRQVVRMRMYDQKKFIQISAELKLPLGTVLTRMQLALKKLRKALDHPSSLR